MPVLAGVSTNWAAAARAAQGAINAATAEAARQTTIRNQALRTLRASDTHYWTFTRLGALVGLTSSTISHIING